MPQRSQPAAAEITRQIVPSVRPAALSPARVGGEFQRLIEHGARLVPVGEARRRPGRLLSLGYTPKHKLELFDAVYYLTNPRQNEDIRFFVAYVMLEPRRIHPRIFYKDVSLTWRSASHFVRSASENWIGKGDVKWILQDGDLVESSDEGTTDLPLEIQTALELLCRGVRRIPHDEDAVRLILRRGPDDRLAPYRDFTEPRRRAAADPRKCVNRGRPIARFTRRNDPTSLRFAAGFEPDLEKGIVEVSEGTSTLYGGPLLRHRVVSLNREAQYLFMSGPRQVWIASCQATTTELMSYGVRTVDAIVDDDLLVPGYEYHFVDELADPPALYSQVPRGFAGAPSPQDPSRVDTSRWLDRMPVVEEFRRKVLRRPSRAR